MFEISPTSADGPSRVIVKRRFQNKTNGTRFKDLSTPTDGPNRANLKQFHKKNITKEIQYVYNVNRWPQSSQI